MNYSLDLFPNLRLLFVDLIAANSTVAMLLAAITALTAAIVYLYQDNKADRKNALERYEMSSKESTAAINGLTAVVREMKDELHEIRLSR